MGKKVRPIPAEREGLFNGSFNAGAQIEVSPFEALELSATYVRDYQTGNEAGYSGQHCRWTRWRRRFSRRICQRSFRW